MKERRTSMSSTPEQHSRRVRNYGDIEIRQATFRCLHIPASAPQDNHLEDAGLTFLSLVQTSLNLRMSCAYTHAYNARSPQRRLTILNARCGTPGVLVKEAESKVFAATELLRHPRSRNVGCSSWMRYDIGPKIEGREGD